MIVQGDVNAIEIIIRSTINDIQLELTANFLSHNGSFLSTRRIVALQQNDFRRLPINLSVVIGRMCNGVSCDNACIRVNCRIIINNLLPNILIIRRISSVDYIGGDFNDKTINAIFGISSPSIHSIEVNCTNTILETRRVDAGIRRIAHSHMRNLRSASSSKAICRAPLYRSRPRQIVLRRKESIRARASCRHRVTNADILQIPKQLFITRCVVSMILVRQ